MPMKHYHSARITDPKQYSDWGYDKDKGGAGVDFVYGIKVKGGKKTSEVQAIRFDTSKFTPEQAKAWLKRNKKRHILFEPAKKAESVSFEEQANEFGELLVEDYVGHPGKLEVDRENRMVRGLVLLGEHSRNGYDYERPAMREADESGLYIGAVLVDQHKRGSRTILEKFAAVRETRYVEEDDGVARIRGNVKVFMNEAGNTFLDIADYAPASAGLSHEARGRMAA